MKVTHTEPPFKPVSATFTFETQQELDMVASLFNIGIVSEAVGRELARVVYGGLVNAGANNHKYINQILSSLQTQARHLS